MPPDNSKEVTNLKENMVYKTNILFCSSGYVHLSMALGQHFGRQLPPAGYIAGYVGPSPQWGHDTGQPLDSAIGPSGGQISV